MNEYALFKYLIQHTELDNKEIFEVIAMAECEKIKKNKIWVHKSHLSYQLGFVSEGLLGWFVKEQPTQVIGFGEENQWIANLLVDKKSMPKSDRDNSRTFLQTDLPYFYKALEDTCIYSYTPNHIRQIALLYPKFYGHILDIYQRLYLANLDHLSAQYLLEADQRYQQLEKKRPSLLQRLPQYLIASYLGLLPTSLSRLRKQFLKSILLVF